MNRTMVDAPDACVKSFGFTSDGTEVHLITLRPTDTHDRRHSPSPDNDLDLPSVQISTLGAAVVSCSVPGRTGSGADSLQLSDIVLGYDNVAAYERNPPYLGVTVGRVAGRIQGAQFKSPVSNQVFHLSRNFQDTHCLHGGERGLSRVVWVIRHVDQQSVLLEHVSPDGADGFPGQMTVHVEFTFRFAASDESDCLELGIEFAASLQSPNVIDRTLCPINLTNHSYWNLAGHQSGREGLARHQVQIAADRYTELNPDNLIPTGRVLPITSDSPLDLRQLRALGPGLVKFGNSQSPGYDQFYVFPSDRDVKQPVATVIDPPSGRRMRVFTDNPGLVFYTGSHLDPLTDPIGKQGYRYDPMSGFCLETQGFPDACNQPEFPVCILDSFGEPYSRHTLYQFDCVMSSDTTV